MGGVPAKGSNVPDVRRRALRERRTERLNSIGEAVRLYRDLERALDSAPDAELAQIIAAARQGEQALEQWARQVEAFRGFKQRFEEGIHPADRPRRRRSRPTTSAARHYELVLVEPKPVPYLWEAIALVAGFVVALLVT
jgi:hypothetical protein